MGCEQIEFRFLDAVLRLAAGAVQLLIHLYGVAFEIGHHEAGVVDLAAMLEPRDHCVARCSSCRPRWPGGTCFRGWFVVGLLTQAPVAHVIRTPKLSFIQGRGWASLTEMAIVIMAFGIFLPMGPLASHFKLLISPLPYLAWLGAILLAQCLLTTLMKRIYIRRFGWQ